MFTVRNGVILPAQIYEDMISPHVYDGFWQTEKYFLHIEPHIRDTFGFKEILMSQRTKEMADRIKNSENSISLHVRRGDYLDIDSTRTFGLEYYNATVNLLRTQHKGGRIYVFSDDVEWARLNLPYKDIEFINWNYGTDSWQDMYLMSQCKYNIIANSTFSWWGAWLNNNPSKIVIAPKKWMVDEPIDSDIIPSSWIRI